LAATDQLMTDASSSLIDPSVAVSGTFSDGAMEGEFISLSVDYRFQVNRME
jgi:hypothetical protein